MKFFIVLSWFLTASLAKAETAVYTGTLNKLPISLTLNFADGTPVESNYIACSDDYDQTCDGPGQYAFLVRSGNASVTYASETASTSMILALYLGEEDTSQGKLSGQYTFEDRTYTIGKIGGITLSNHDIVNKIKAQAQGLTISGFTLPTSYTLDWTDHSGYGSITLNRQ